MKKYRIFYLLLICLLLAACSEREITFERQFPDTTKLDEIKAELKAARQNTDEYKKFSYLLDSNIKPPTFTLISTEDGEMLELEPFLFCWNEELSECDHLNTNDLLENDNIYIKSITLSKRKMYSIDTRPITDELPAPAHLEFTPFNGADTPMSFGYGKSNETTYEFESPVTSDTYTVLIKAYYQSGISGVGLYAYKMIIED